MLHFLPDSPASADTVATRTTARAMAHQCRSICGLLCRKRGELSRATRPALTDGDGMDRPAAGIRRLRVSEGWVGRGLRGLSTQPPGRSMLSIQFENAVGVYEEGV